MDEWYEPKCFRVLNRPEENELEDDEEKEKFEKLEEERKRIKEQVDYQRVNQSIDESKRSINP
jgi:hypothetical protein